MIRINLLAERRVKKGGAPGAPGVPAAPREGFKPIYIVYILLMLAAAGYIGYRYWNLTTTISEKEKETRDLQKERDRLAEIIRKANEFQIQKDLLQKKIDVINDLQKQQRIPVILLDQLSRNLPEYVWFESVTQNMENVSIEGWAINPTKISDFIDNLINSGYFINVDAPTWQRTAGKARFRLNATFRIPEGEG